MAAPAAPRRRTANSYPGRPDWSHPITVALTAAQVADRVIVGTQLATPLGASGATPRGRSMPGGGAGHTIQHTRYILPSTPVITQMIVVHKGSGSGAYGAWCNTQWGASPASSEWSGYTIALGNSGDNNGSNLLMLDNLTAWRTGSSLADGPHVIIVVTTSASTHVVWVDGARISSLTATTALNLGSPLYTQVASQTASGRTLPSTNSLAGVVVWQRGLTENEIALLSTDPWCWISPAA